MACRDDDAEAEADTEAESGNEAGPKYVAAACVSSLPVRSTPELLANDGYISAHMTL